MSDSPHQAGPGVPDVKRFPSEKDALFAAGSLLVRHLARVGRTPILFLVSGGSSIRVLDAMDPAAFPSDFTVGLIDERMDVPVSDTNRDALIRSEFGRRIRMRKIPFLAPVIGKPDEVEKCAAAYSQSLSGWFRDRPDGRLVTLLGLGEDGHTAGIMPFPEDEGRFTGLFDDPGRKAVGYDAGQKSRFPLRVTVTLPLLRRSSYCAMFAAGDGKKDALGRLMADGAKVHEVPGAVIRQMPRVSVFTDIAL